MIAPFFVSPGHGLTLIPLGLDSNEIIILIHLLGKALECVEMGRSERNLFIGIDKQIHMTLAEITGNPIYISILHSIHENIHRYYDRFLSMEETELQENYQDLCRLVEAVEIGRVDQARELARDHVKRFNQYMKKREDAFTSG